MTSDDRPSKAEHGLPFLSAILFWVSFPPLNGWPLMWLAPVPLLAYILVRPLTWKRAGILYLAAYAAWTMNIYWFWYVTPPGMFLAPLYRAFMWPAYAGLVRWVKGPAWLSAPVLWVLQEYLALVFPVLGFPFKMLGYSQIDMLAFVQIADVGGVWIVGFVIVMFASLVAQAAIQPERLSMWKMRSWRWGAIACAAALLLSFVYGSIRLSTLEIKEGPKLLIVQPNIPQDVKEMVAQQKETGLERYERMERIYRKHIELTRAGLRERVDLVVWPEATIPDFVVVDATGAFLDKRSYPWLVSPPRQFKTPFLSGCSLYNIDSDRVYNSACLVGEDGKIRGRYDKVTLVAFGEYVPWPFEWFVRQFTPLFPIGSPGPDFVVWEASGVRLGPEICFEGLVPEITSRIARKGAQGIVNISNDGWFKDSSELDETLAMARFRSLESRVGFVRSTNTGISAIIDPAGRITGRIDGKEVDGTLVGRLPLTDSSSVYRAVGDLFVGLCALAALGLAVGGRIR